jgi:biotin transport system ATP-binding protein
MIEVKNICKEFKISTGKISALKNVSFKIDTGECVVIGGENGSGKSVLMSILSGLDCADSGTVNCNQKIGLVFQDAETQILGETPEEDVAFGLKNTGWKKNNIEEQVSYALQKVGLYEKKDYPARFLSGGEKRRLAVACMIAMENPVIIFDEPYANLDYTSVKQVNKLIIQLKNEKKTVIVLTHEIEKCLALADRFIVLFRGNKVYDGKPDELNFNDIEKWNIKNPFTEYKDVKDLIW